MISFRLFTQARDKISFDLLRNVANHFMICVAVSSKLAKHLTFKTNINTGLIDRCRNLKI